MAVGLKVTLKPSPRLYKALKAIDPTRNAQIFVDSLEEIALRIQTDAQTNQILRGGGPVDAKKLTNRTGNLRDNIGIHRKKMPFQISIGARAGKYKPIPYARKHELGEGIKKRPFMLPALKTVKPLVGRIFVKHWRKHAGV